ncbi:MAG: glycine/sarcosine/betaine reductase complex component C subunit beta [Firmicutes bacterium]|nr:glycine/sarcosine/betaine reductase complex component C subunit beta [Bacillota bacterium]
MNSVIKGAAYILAHAPDMVLHNGTTQTTERIVNPQSEFLTKLPKHLRAFKDVVSYVPNQVYIGNKKPEDLLELGDIPWHNKPLKKSDRFAKSGEIMPQDEFYLFIKGCDVFGLVQLEKAFVAKVKPSFAKHPLINEEFLAKLGDGVELTEIEKAVKETHAEGLYQGGKLVGCVKKGHDIDENLSAHVLLENLVSKATCVLSLMNLVKGSGVDKAEIDLVIDCSEEAVGDMNQRGGGNLAKACAETAGFVNASGSDIRAFCAAPVHALIHAAALVASGTYDNVIVAAGGSTAKLGMNAKDHVKKEMPILEDVIGGFAVLVSKNDGVSPEILHQFTGKHTVGSGSSPQAVTTALVTAPLDKYGIQIKDICKFSAEMHNPDVTKPAGAGDVPLANFKMIGALAVMRGEMERTAIDEFTKNHGMPGWAPTQGHIPSGVPYLGFAREDIMSGKIVRSMIIGKGSLFLGRMTNLFDGASFIIEKNSGANSNLTTTDHRQLTTDHLIPKIIVTGLGSEHGEKNMLEGACQAANSGEAVLYLGKENCDCLTAVKVKDEKESHEKMEKMLKSNEADAAVTMHYPFPVGVSTIGRVVTPSLGKTMYIASTTGTSATDRVEAMVKNAIYGIITAKSCGVKKPTIGILNVDGARAVEKALKELKKNGYDINFAESGRSDGGCIMRGNDALTGTCDVLVCDTLTGNILMKTFSSFTTGGNYEALGWGYGPGVGENFNNLVLIVSRASGTPVIANAVRFASELVKGDYKKILKSEFTSAKKAKLADIIAESKPKSVGASNASPKKIEPPAKEIVTSEISGIEITDLEDAVTTLHGEKIYAESGMGCTGPIVLVNEKNLKKAVKILTDKKFILG